MGRCISLPSGGGAISGLGEKFSADLFTGTGNFSVPITLPPGRAGLQPQLALSFSTGNGNGVFGLGWALSLPGVARKTSRGVPRYQDGAAPGGEDADTFILSGAEDLVPVSGVYPGRVRYRPRTEGLFARIEHIRDTTGDYWEVRGKDGLLTRYGTPRPRTRTPAGATPRSPATPGTAGTAACSPGGSPRPSTCSATSSVTPTCATGATGRATPGISRWSAGSATPTTATGATRRFWCSVDFDYEPRPDPFSDYRAGFEIRTSLRCRAIRVATHAADGVVRAVREYRFGYEQAPFNGASLLTRVDVVGIDDQDDAAAVRASAAADVRLLGVRPGAAPVPAGDRPRACRPARWATRRLPLVDLRGNGLPDIVELGASPRYWRNRGDGRFDLPRLDGRGAAARDSVIPACSFIDADGDGRADLVVTARAPQAGYFPLTFAGGLEPALVPAVPAGRRASASTTRGCGWSTSTATG